MENELYVPYIDSCYCSNTVVDLSKHHLNRSAGKSTMTSTKSKEKQYSIYVYDTWHMYYANTEQYINLIRFFFLPHHSKLRVTVLGFACAFGYAPCLKTVGDEFNKWISNSTVRPTPDLRSLIYYYGILANGKEENWNIVWNLYLNETDASEKAKIMSALSAVQDPILLKQYVKTTFKSNS